MALGKCDSVVANASIVFLARSAPPKAFGTGSSRSCDNRKRFSAATELAMLEACVRAGAADGITGRREATVDALPAAVHASIVELLQALIAKVA